MSAKHPYVGLPDHQMWKRAAGAGDAAQLDPVTDAPFKITTTDRIVTAGSCFAQHMTASGYNHFITEKAHPMFPPGLAAEHNFGIFSARYGNLYTARQLLQLLLRAYGLFEPQAVSWPARNGSDVVDPFRPQIQPGGFLSEDELLADRKQHFAAIREAVENLDVFVFTLGLTETWEDTRDGAVFPIAPGVAGGVYDPDTVAFRNFDETETADDLAAALAFIRDKNPGARFILTVSPVSLNATYESRHVWSSTVWSKAVLRIAAERVSRALNDCCYFPSFEVITSPHVRGRYFANDGREVREAGVKHVMLLFAKHFFEAGAGAVPPAPVAETTDAHTEEMEDLMDVLCDEAAIDNT